MDIFGNRGFKGQIVHTAPTFVCRGQASLHRDGSGTHIGQDVQNVCTQVFLDIEFDEARLPVDCCDFVVGSELDDVFVVFRPEFFEQSSFGGDIWVGVQNEHLGFRLGLLKVMRHLTGSFIGSRRTAVGCFGYGQGIDTAIGHVLQLFTQSRGFCTCFPSLQDAAIVVGRFQTFDAVKHHVNTGRQNQFVVGQGGAIGQGDGSFVCIDTGDAVLHDRYTMFFHQATVGCGEVVKCFAATNHQVGHGARQKTGIGLYQGDRDVVARQHSNVFGGCCAAITTTNDNHPRFVRCVLRKHRMAQKYGR